MLFAAGSVCFAAASFASQWASAPRPGIGVTFFAGSIAFTAASYLQLTATARGPWRGDRLAALVQLAGTLFFNMAGALMLTTGAAPAATRAEAIRRLAPPPPRPRARS